MKIAFSGSHGTGKTTSCYELAYKYQVNGHTCGILPEVARKCPLAINQNTTYEAQLWIFSKQIEEEIKLSRRYGTLICDRTLIDTIAYTRFICGDLWKEMFNISKYMMPTYDKIYFKKVDNNENFFKEDGVRDMDPVFRKTIDSYINEMYDELIIDNIILPSIIEYQ